MENLYKPDDSELKAFGKHWCGPARFEPWVDTLVAVYTTEEDSDGQSVEVYCCAAPARFYKLKVLSGFDSVKTPQPAYEVVTGSGASKMAAELAEAIQQGMIGFKPPVA